MHLQMKTTSATWLTTKCAILHHAALPPEQNTIRHKWEMILKHNKNNPTLEQHQWVRPYITQLQQQQTGHHHNQQHCITIWEPPEQCTPRTHNTSKNEKQNRQKLTKNNLTAMSKNNFKAKNKNQHRQNIQWYRENNRPGKYRPRETKKRHAQSNLTEKHISMPR